LIKLDFFFEPDLFKGVIFPGRAAVELHATSRARQAYAPSYEAPLVKGDRLET
jgi:hypothetical protein